MIGAGSSAFAVVVVVGAAVLGDVEEIDEAGTMSDGDGKRVVTCPVVAGVAAGTMSDGDGKRVVTCPVVVGVAAGTMGDGDGKRVVACPFAAGVDAGAVVVIEDLKPKSCINVTVPGSFDVVIGDTAFSFPFAILEGVSVHVGDVDDGRSRI
jgi:hypothetical protein